ncbi:MAG: hypothetical protein A3B70_02235 [Deltaproteobacteria bacterium RIFCSPHIGHO2_02_FULL_40_11]|nr:MAG: hypothetical protein A3B70_02235 [Deltaproteobacteria bacterium RIFCSPHIGHO2_02_FULL_40_11]
MKSKLKFLAFGSALIVLLYTLAQLPTHTKVGINFELHEETLPLYMKATNFLSRHFETKRLALKIIGDLKSPKDKVQAIYEWTTKNIHPTPKGFTIVDDHPLHIAIRGYGEPDQMNDLFSLLCTYAGVDAFFYDFKPKAAYSLAFVKLDGAWRVFDIPKKIQFPNIDTPLSRGMTYKNLLDGFQPLPHHLDRNKKQKPIDRLILFFF